MMFTLFKNDRLVNLYYKNGNILIVSQKKNIIFKKIYKQVDYYLIYLKQKNRLEKSKRFFFMIKF